MMRGMLAHIDHVAPSLVERLGLDHLAEPAVAAVAVLVSAVGYVVWRLTRP